MAKAFQLVKGYEHGQKMCFFLLNLTALHCCSTECCSQMGSISAYIQFSYSDLSNRMTVPWFHQANRISQCIFFQILEQA